MTAEQNPEDEKYLESLKNLLKVSEEHETNQQTNEEVDEDDVETEESDIQPTIPPEHQIEPAERIEPLQSMVDPDYVRKVIRTMDTMSTDQLRQALQRIKVSTGGNKKTLRKRVAQYYRKENALLNRKLEPNSDKTLRYFDYLIAIDFECTCVEIIYDYPHEIIELPAVLIDVREMKIISEFRSYVRPVKNPKLSDFCIQFTKIAQETVDEAPYFREALEKLMQWMRKFGLGEKNTRFAFVTDGPHDMWKFMQFQCILSNIRMPHMFRNFINIKKTFKEKFNGLMKGNGKSGIENMLERLDLTFIGNKHSGLDDARNIAQIAIQMMKLKIELRINQKCSWVEPKNQIIKDDDDLDDNVDTIDVSRRDFQLWLRRLPLKLSSVTRREFLSEEYLDCESCDDMTDDKHDRQSFAEKMTIRQQIEALDEEEREKMKNEPPIVRNGPPKPVPPPPATTTQENDDSENDEEFLRDYQRQVELLDMEESLDAISNSNGIELEEVWECAGSEMAAESVSLDNLAYSSSESLSLEQFQYPTSQNSTHPPTPETDVMMNSDSIESMELMAPPPKNSLASTNRNNNRNY
ncbi:hypothetical protein L5515_012879 [Caenorhabditis briggsae]|uniref:SAP domain-containing protein n=1 Tax=Caenorhabditis briggsae TaxID=6238 RepID=A0AAE9JH52_CAEBR|nr:hypothetical protein L5515_012879 [Caenorhabditis briggsae]